MTWTDREKAADELAYVMDGYYIDGSGLDRVLDTLEALTTPDRTVDRDALNVVVSGMLSNDSDWHLSDKVDEILALLRPSP